MLQLLCMFEDGCLFYTLANFYREQSNLKGIVFEFEVFVSPISERESAAFVFILYRPVITVARAYSVKSPRNKRQTHTIKLGKYIFKI